MVHKLPATMAEVILKICKAASIDMKVLNETTMSRTMVSYKMTNGIARTYHGRTIASLKKNFFSLNIDESKANNESYETQFLTILVSYYCESLNRIIVEHLASIGLKALDSKALYSELVNIFNDYELDWNKLVSILMDSCNTMRGKKAGFETLIRKGGKDVPAVAEHLIDIDGDACHHFHNTVGKLCEPFDNHIEDFFNNIAVHFRTYGGQIAVLEELCDIIGIKFTMPDKFCEHRWLYALDCSYGTWRIYPAYIIYFYAKLPVLDERIYSKLMNEVYDELNLDEDGKRKVLVVQSKIRNRKFSVTGVSRIEKILDALFKYSKKTRLIMRFYIGILPTFKEYVCTFQSSEPLIHKINDAQENLFRNYLGYFVKHEYFSELLPREFLTLKIEDKHLMSVNKIFFGHVTKQLMLKFGMEDPDVIDFTKKAMKAFKEALIYMQNKIPLNNKMLRRMSAFDPVIYVTKFDKEQNLGRDVAKIRLLAIPKDVKFVLTDDETEVYDREVNNFVLDRNLPPYEEKGRVDEKGQVDEKEKGRVDEWWCKVKQMGKYPNLSKMALALLTCFHGPLVESSFNTMDMIMDKRSCNMSVDTYNAYQTTQYYFRARNATPVQEFYREDHLNGPIDSELCNNMMESASRNKKKTKRSKGGKGQCKPRY